MRGRSSFLTVLFTNLISLAPSSAQLGIFGGGDTACYGSGGCTVDRFSNPLTFWSLVANSQCIETDETCAAVSKIGCNVAPGLGETCRSCYATCDAALSYLSRQGLSNGDLVNFCASSALAESSYCAACEDLARCPQQTPSPTPSPTANGTTPAPATPAPSTAAPTVPPTPAPTVEAPPVINAMLIGALTLPSEVMKGVEARRLQEQRQQRPQRQRQRRQLDSAALEHALAAFLKVDSSDVYVVDGSVDATDYLGTNDQDNNVTTAAVAVNDTASVGFVVAYYGTDAKQQALVTLDWLQQRGSWIALAAMLSMSPEDATLTKISNPITATDSTIMYEGPWTVPAATGSSSSSSDDGSGSGATPTGDSGTGGGGGSGGTWWTYVVAASGAVALFLGVLYVGMLVRRKQSTEEENDLPKFRNSPETVRALSASGHGGGGGGGGGGCFVENEEYKIETPVKGSSSEGIVSPPKYDAPKLPSDAAAVISPGGSVASSSVYGGVADGGRGLALLAAATAAAAAGLAVSSSSSSPPRGAQDFAGSEGGDCGGSFIAGADGADDGVGNLGSHGPSPHFSGYSSRFGGPGSAFDSRQPSTNAFSMHSSTGEGLRPAAWSPSSRGVSQSRGGILSTASGASSASASPSAAAAAARRNNNRAAGTAAHSPTGSEDSAWQRAWMMGRNIEQRFFGGGPRTPTRGAMERARVQAAPWR